MIKKSCKSSYSQRDTVEVTMDVSPGVIVDIQYGTGSGAGSALGEKLFKTYTV